MSNVAITGDNTGQAAKEGAIGVLCGRKAFQLLRDGNRILMHLKIEDLQAIHGLQVVEDVLLPVDVIEVVRIDGSTWKRWKGVR